MVRVEEGPLVEGEAVVAAGARHSDGAALCCVPTLLATIEQDLPDLRLLIVSGDEAASDPNVRALAEHALADGLRQPVLGACADGVARRAVHLRRAPQRVGVLHAAVALAVVLGVAGDPAAAGLGTASNRAR